ncbi:type II secretion system F family protein [Pseudofulvibacter geojedonensis]|uniref:Type II secretion system F family protein n=1 Tax=Pseudofulvibacter geojedonensis TaxID=1123758 RepID=A0ABW3I1W8_9FLAO
MGFKIENTAKKANSKSNEGFDIDAILKKEITFLGSSFSSKLKEDFYTELSILLKAGIALREALELLKKAQKKKHNEEMLTAIVIDIVAGNSFSEALKKHKSFTEYEYYSLKIGEETGTLARVCEQLGGFFGRKNEQQRNLVGALTYPIIILSTAVLVVVFMLQFVVPMFQDIFKQQKVELPIITKIIIDFSEFIKNYNGLLLLLVVGMFLANMFLKKNIKYKKIKDNVLLKLPYIGKFVKAVYLSQFTQAVTLLTSSKVPVVNSIQLVKQMISFYPIQIALSAVENQLLKGDSLSDSLAKHKLFDDKMIAMVKVAEETNQTEFIFERLNTQYNTQVSQQSKNLSTIIEPLIIVFVGFFVGVILVAMYLPMFKLSSVLG